MRTRDSTYPLSWVCQRKAAHAYERTLIDHSWNVYQALQSSWLFLFKPLYVFVFTYWFSFRLQHHNDLLLLPLISIFANILKHSTWKSYHKVKVGFYPNSNSIWPTPKTRTTATPFERIGPVALVLHLVSIWANWAKMQVVCINLMSQRASDFPLLKNLLRFFFHEHDFLFQEEKKDFWKLGMVVAPPPCQAAVCVTRSQAKAGSPGRRTRHFSFVLFVLLFHFLSTSCLLFYTN